MCFNETWVEKRVQKCTCTLFSHLYSTAEQYICRAKHFHLMIIIPVREKFSLALETVLVLKLNACVEIYYLSESEFFGINISINIPSFKNLLNNGDWQLARAARQRHVSAALLFCSFFKKFIRICCF